MRRMGRPDVLQKLGRDGSRTPGCRWSKCNRKLEGIASMYYMSNLQQGTLGNLSNFKELRAWFRTEGQVTAQLKSEASGKISFHAGDVSRTWLCHHRARLPHYRLISWRRGFKVLVHTHASVFVGGKIELTVFKQSAPAQLRLSIRSSIMTQSPPMASSFDKLPRAILSSVSSQLHNEDHAAFMSLRSACRTCRKVLKRCFFVETHWLVCAMRERPSSRRFNCQAKRLAREYTAFDLFHLHGTPLLPSNLHKR